MSSAYKWDAYLAEAVGTFLFLFMGIGAGYALFGESWAAAGVAIALAHGLALAVMVSAFGAISGGHFNPAVTFGLWITGRIEPVKAAGYVIAQLVGAVVAAGVVGYIYPLEVPSTALTQYGDVRSDDDHLFAENAVAYAIVGIDPEVALIVPTRPGAGDDAGSYGNWILLERGAVILQLCPYFDPNSEFTPPECLEGSP